MDVRTAKALVVLPDRGIQGIDSEGRDKWKTELRIQKGVLISLRLKGYKQDEWVETAGAGLPRKSNAFFIRPYLARELIINSRTNDLTLTFLGSEPENVALEPFDAYNISVTSSQV